MGFICWLILLVIDIALATQVLHYHPTINTLLIQLGIRVSCKDRLEPHWYFHRIIYFRSTSADTLRNNNVIITSKWRCKVVWCNHVVNISSYVRWDLVIPQILSATFNDIIGSTRKPGKLERKHILSFQHDDVIKWRYFPRYWPFGIHQSSVDSPHKGQWRGALIFSLMCAWRNGRVNNRDAGDLRLRRAHYGVIVMIITVSCWYSSTAQW